VFDSWAFDSFMPCQCFVMLPAALSCSF
jgi:hypothetical protein